MNHLLIVLLQLTYIIPSLLLYCIILAYIVWSRDPEFNSAFHRIFLARAPADILQVTISLIAFRLPLAGWTGCLRYPILAKIGFVLTQYTTLLELWAQLLLSANRLTAISFPIGHRKVWARRPTLFMFVFCASISVIPTLNRLEQPVEYIYFNNTVIPALKRESDQRQNSFISCCIYFSFCSVSLFLNIAAIWIHSKQRRLQLFDSQQKLAIRVQTNLLIYSCFYTLVVCSMTIFQSMLAFNIYSVQSPGYFATIILLTLSADLFALSNPWKFLVARRFPKIRSSFTADTGEAGVLHNLRSEHIPIRFIDSLHQM